MEGEDLDRLHLRQMVPTNTDSMNTAFTVTCDYRHGTSTGISAADRARTLRALADRNSLPTDFNRPGHIFPLRYREGGVLKRAGHTEAAVDFSRLAGCAPVGVLSEVVNDADGSMARLPDLRIFAKTHGLVLTSIADLVQYRRLEEKLVVRIDDATARLPTRYGEFDTYAYRSVLDGVDHLALVKGAEPGPDGKLTFGDEPVIVRVHSECCTGDVFGSLRCDCGPQLDFCMREVAKVGRGVVVYLRGQEGRGIGLGHKMRAYALQDKGRDTVEANVELGLPVDSREYGIGAQILADLGLSKIRIMTNNPAKYSGLGGYGLSIVDRVPVEISANPENANYLRTKRDKLGHWLGEDSKLGLGPSL
jgi:3,4-dihydroxy 2-butanone 4-phosphate synthase/GTP cyclohydrolase II